MKWIYVYQDKETSELLIVRKPKRRNQFQYYGIMFEDGYPFLCHWKEFLDTYEYVGRL